MGTGTAKRAPAKDGRSPIATRRSATKSIKTEKTPSPSPAKSTSTRKRGGATPRTGFTHHLPTAEERKSNGRVAGRSLIVWGRPRMAEKLLLHVQYECARHKIVIPWDTVAHRLHPGSSGAAIIQHLNRIRRELVAEGHLVPPLTTRSGGCNSENSDPRVRGFVRKDMDGEDKESVRPVGFDEAMDDRKFNLPSVDNFEVVAENTGYELDDLEGTDNEGDLPQLDSHSPSDDSIQSINYTYGPQSNVQAYAPLLDPASFLHSDTGHPDLDVLAPTTDETVLAGNDNHIQPYHEDRDEQSPQNGYPNYPFPNINPMIYHQAMLNEAFPFPMHQGHSETFETQANFFAGNGAACPKSGYAGPGSVYHPYTLGHPWVPYNPVTGQPFPTRGPQIVRAAQQTPMPVKEEQPRYVDSFVVKDAQPEQPIMDDLFNANGGEDAIAHVSQQENAA